MYCPLLVWVVVVAEGFLLKMLVVRVGILGLKIKELQQSCNSPSIQVDGCLIE